MVVRNIRRQIADEQKAQRRMWRKSHQAIAPIAPEARLNEAREEIHGRSKAQLQEQQVMTDKNGQ